MICNFALFLEKVSYFQKDSLKNEKKVSISTKWITLSHWKTLHKRLPLASQKDGNEGNER